RHSTYSFFLSTDTSANDTYTLSLHDALPIYDIGTRVTMSMGGPGYQVATHRSTHGTVAAFAAGAAAGCAAGLEAQQMRLLLDYRDRKSTRLNSSHVSISYAVFCLKKKSDVIE